MCKECKFEEPAKCPRCDSEDIKLTIGMVMDSKAYMGSTRLCRCNNCGLKYYLKQIFDRLTWESGQKDLRQTGKPEPVACGGEL